MPPQTACNGFASSRQKWLVVSPRNLMNAAYTSRLMLCARPLTGMTTLRVSMHWTHLLSPQAIPRLHGILQTAFCIPKSLDKSTNALVAASMYLLARVCLYRASRLTWPIIVTHIKLVLGRFHCRLIFRYWPDVLSKLLAVPMCDCLFGISLGIRIRYCRSMIMKFKVTYHLFKEWVAVAFRRRLQLPIARMNSRIAATVEISVPHILQNRCRLFLHF